jgi:quercetin dioxygenase-like cupin family protein
MADANDKLQNVLTELLRVTPPFLPTDGEVMTISVEWPPGESGLPPHRHPGGPAFGYVLDGEMVFELEGEPPRVVTAGETFWEPGGDVIHYQDGNHRTDIPLRYIVTMIMAPGKPMLVLLDDDELKQSGWVRRSPA